jgi:hypothetical protein
MQGFRADMPVTLAEQKLCQSETLSRGPQACVTKFFGIIFCPGGQAILPTVLSAFGRKPAHPGPFSAKFGAKTLRAA